MARLAITKDFLAEYAKLDKRVQSAVDAAIADFANGRHAEACLEKAPGSLDDRIRLLRVDGAWYGVVLVPDSGDTYCLITILPTDEAVGYATSHRSASTRPRACWKFATRPPSRQLQPSLQAVAGPDGKRLFADVSDADLTRLGIDAQSCRLVRLLANEADLDALQPVLPDAQYAALHALACGMTVDEA